MSEAIDQIAGADGYELSVRRFEPTSPPLQQLVLLHGVVSHSQWLTPIAERLARTGIRVIAPDRRGVGLNSESPGDAPGVTALLDDAAAVLQHYREAAIETHFGGFCWGATYALNQIERHRTGIASFVMIAPSIFPAADVGGAELVTGDDPTPRCTPNVPIDRFTSGPDFEGFIVPDPLRTRSVSPRFNQCMVDMNQLLAPRWAKLRMPTLMILAEDDRLSDNDKHLRAWRHVRGVAKSHIMVNGEHGVQFDAAEPACDAIVAWLNGIANDATTTAPASVVQ